MAGEEDDEAWAQADMSAMRRRLLSLIHSCYLEAISRLPAAARGRPPGHPRARPPRRRPLLRAPPPRPQHHPQLHLGVALLVRPTKRRLCTPPIMNTLVARTFRKV